MKNELYGIGMQDNPNSCGFYDTFSPVDKVFASGRIFGLIWQNILKISWQH
jgi:hypothetical protein